jgi:hypothetical protein
MNRTANTAANEVRLYLSTYHLTLNDYFKFFQLPNITKLRDCQVYNLENVTMVYLLATCSPVSEHIHHKMQRVPRTCPGEGLHQSNNHIL